MGYADAMRASMSGQVITTQVWKPSEEDKRFFNLQLVQRAFNTIKELPFAGARLMLAKVLIALNRAEEIAHESSAIEKYLTPLKDIREHLKWHVERSMVKFEDYAKPYPYLDDLKKWATNALVEYNSILEGDSWLTERASTYREIMYALEKWWKRTKEEYGSLLKWALIIMAGAWLWGLAHRKE